MTRRSRDMRQVTDWQAAPLPDVVGHIAERHHAFTREAISRLSALIAEVAQAPNSGEPEQEALADAFGRLRVRLEHHLLTEEVGLFPLVRQAAAGQGGSRAGTSATAAYHIRHLRHEHEAIEQDAARVRELLAVAAPQGGQEPALRAFARLLDELGADLAEHVKLEEEVLFPRLVAD